jgi:hypothetical protein
MSIHSVFVCVWGGGTYLVETMSRPDRLLAAWLLDSVQQPHVQQPSMYAKSEAASAVLGS